MWGKLAGIHGTPGGENVVVREVRNSEEEKERKQFVYQTKKKKA